MHVSMLFERCYVSLADSKDSNFEVYMYIESYIELSGLSRVADNRTLEWFLRCVSGLSHKMHLLL